MRLAHLFAAAAFAATTVLTAVPDPTPAGARAWPEAHSDFDGDGRSDFVLPVSDEGVGSAELAGAVHVLYGSRAGATADGDDYWYQGPAKTGVYGTSEAEDHFGAAYAAGDFDGDGFDDLAIGVPGEDTYNYTLEAVQADAGQVNVLYGSRRGLGLPGQHVLVPGTGGLAGSTVAGDEFGSTLAAGDFDGDGVDDLAVGVPKKDVDTSGDGAADISDAGAVHVVYGEGGAGLSSEGDVVLSQATDGVPGAPNASAKMSISLAAGFFDDNVRTDLAVGVPGATAGGAVEAGAVVVLLGSSSGLATSGALLVEQDDAGQTSEEYDSFGRGLAAGDFDGDAMDELAVGAPRETFDVDGDGSADGTNVGAVTVVPGGADGLDPSDATTFTRATKGVPGGPHSYEYVGDVLAVAGLIGSRAGLLVGVPGEDVVTAAGAVENAGSVLVIPGGRFGLDFSRTLHLTQNTPGVVSRAERGDRFGEQIWVGDADAGPVGGIPDVGIGVSGESYSARREAGGANLVYGRSDFGTYLRGPWWSEDSTGVLGHAEPFDHAGR